MNVNEVIANRAIEILGGQLGDKVHLTNFKSKFLECYTSKWWC